VEPAKKRPDEDDHFWQEFRNDVRDYILHFDHENIDQFSQIVKSFGGGLKDVWKIVRDIPAKILNQPLIADRVDQDDRDHWAALGTEVGTVVGFVAAGGHAVAGGVKLVSAIKRGHAGRALDGLVDMAAGTSLALAVAGLAGAKAIVGPIAATINLVRGVYNAATGWKRRDKRKQLQGVLDVARSAGSFGRLMKQHGTAFGVLGVAMAPIAGGIQAGRGIHDLSIGLRNNDNKKELKGLVDIATAVGTAMAFASGVAVIPGVALAVAANLVKVGYQLSPRIRRKVDKVIDKHEPKLARFVSRADKVSGPVVRTWEKFMSRLIKDRDVEGPLHYSAAELAEITRLVHCDGRYSKAEYDRLRTTLESVGQKKDLPKRDAPLPEPKRPELLEELATPQQRKDFIRLMLVVADYDLYTKPEETEYSRQLARELGIPETEFEALLQERRARLKLELVQAGLGLPVPGVSEVIHLPAHDPPGPPRPLTGRT
jgi:hypothetical protein